MARIFISYRRADSRLVTNRIYDRLVQAFGNTDVFKDINNIPPGKDFRGVLREATATCEIMLVIIGPDWLDICDSAGQRRLDDPNDFVRLEVQTGLERENTLVIPVLVEKAVMPATPHLPDVLKELSYNSAFTVSDDPHFHRDMDTLIAYMREHLTGRKRRQIDWRWIVGAVMIPLIAAVITILPSLINNAPTLPPTATITQDITETPSDTLTPTMQSQTTESELTQIAAIVSTDEPADMVEHTAMPTSSQTPVPLDIPLTPVTRNNDWTPIERDFNGVRMVLVPSGSFAMGSESLYSAPIHTQEISFPFWIDKTEVTRAMYAQCVEDEVCIEIAESDKSDQPNQPIISINWFQARDYCLWRGARLPSELEWEYAARGPDGLVYPWGDQFTLANTVFGLNSGLRAAVVGSRPVGASWVGALDMSGNVFEWTSTIFDQDRFPYPYANDDREDPENSTRLRVLRGGSWVDGYDREHPIHYTVSLNSTNRARDYPQNARNIYGLRCAMDTPSLTANNQWIPVEQEFNSISMVLVPAGCFEMGSEDGDEDEQPIHEICFDTPFWIDKYEVTNSAFDRLGGEAGRNSFWEDANRPRESITWFEAKAFCELRNGRLPTEAEWEYAARGPSNLTYPWGNEFIPSNVAYAANTSNQSEPVGSKPGGASWVGAWDMSGNVWEWVLSRYESYPYVNDERNDFLGTNDRRARVNRGGSWGSGDYSLRATYRRRNPPNEQYNILGFRCLIESESVSPD